MESNDIKIIVMSKIYDGKCRVTRILIISCQDIEKQYEYKRRTNFDRKLRSGCCPMKDLHNCITIDYG